MYKCKYFSIDELVCPEWYHLADKKQCLDRLWLAFPEELLVSLDRLRERFGPLIVNNWMRGGMRCESGLRWAPTQTGAVLSQHKFGRAIDFVSKTVTPEEVYQDLIRCGGLKAGFKSRTDQEAAPWVGIDRIEYYPGITWTHIDRAGTGFGNSDGSIKVFTG